MGKRPWGRDCGEEREEMRQRGETSERWMERDRGNETEGTDKEEDTKRRDRGEETEEKRQRGET